jgi:hypothetical protein
MQQAPTTEQRMAMEEIKKFADSNSAAEPMTEDLELNKVMQESMPWKEVKRTKNTPVERTETAECTMKKVKITVSIRVPREIQDFNPAKLHIDTLHEIHKFDDSLIIMNSSGDTKINIKAMLSEEKYKKTFQPHEKRVGRGPSVLISIAHDICITTTASTIKESIFPFLKKHKIFIYFNPKPGLEHFSAIGLLFGPNPDYTWRDELSELLTESMKPMVTDEEKQKLGTNDNGDAKIILSLNVQTIGQSSQSNTTSVALEIRVPSGMERIYTGIIERMYEKAEDEEINIPSKLGKFFPYYLKSKMSDVFEFLMRQQNAEMTSTTIIPIFGYTPEARQQQIELDREQTTVELAIATMKNII